MKETKEIKIECPEEYEVDKERSSFEKIVFKKKEKELPKTWEKYLKLCEYRDFITINKEITLKADYKDGFIALSKLLELRDYYNDEWEPDWTDDSDKFIINFAEGSIDTCCYCHTQAVLVFKSKELRDEFYKNFKDLIEQAKELL